MQFDGQECLKLPKEFSKYIKVHHFILNMKLGLEVANTASKIPCDVEVTNIQN